MPQLLTSSGRKLFYRDSGQGTPLMFIHGWLMSGKVWACQSPLTDGFRVIVPDLPGHGESDGDEFDYAHAVADLVELCEYLRLERVVLVGWSMGAQLALRSFPLLRNRLAGLVLVGGTPLFCREDGYDHGLPPAEARTMALRLRRSFSRTAGEFYQGMFSPAEVREHAPAPLAGSIVGRLPELPLALAALDELIRTDLRNQLAEITAPVLLVHGEADRICLPGASSYMHDKLPNSRLHLFAGAGHAPFLTRAGEFNALLVAFARGLDDAD
jgi:pimeloyl-[acyl-carrier protein] methyl ester esterase